MYIIHTCIYCTSYVLCTLHLVPCSFPGADDDSLFQKFERQQKNHAHYRSPQLKQQDPQFTILHYASEVTYSVKVNDYYSIILL